MRAFMFGSHSDAPFILTPVLNAPCTLLLMPYTLNHIITHCLKQEPSSALAYTPVCTYFCAGGHAGRDQRQGHVAARCSVSCERAAADGHQVSWSGKEGVIIFFKFGSNSRRATDPIEHAYYIFLIKKTCHTISIPLNWVV